MLRFLYLLFLPLTLYAQSTHHTVKGWQELTISEGLSQGMVFDIKQDHNGFVWVATKDGLNRFDGHNFTVFTHDPYNEYSLSNNSASALLIDSKGRLWIGTLNGGLNLFDERTQRFYHIAITDQSAPNAGNFEVVRLAEDPEGNIWVNTSNYKLYRFTLPDQFKTHFPDSPTFRASFKRMDIPFTQTNDGLFYIRFEPNGQGVLGMTRGRYQFNWRQMNAVVPIHPLNPYDPNDIFTSQTSGAESWFLASRDHVHAWYKGAHKVIHLPHEGSSSTILQFLDDSTVAIADLNYLWLMSPAQLVAQDSLTARNAFAAMPPNLFSYKVILKDKTGLIWIGTAGYGLRVFNPRTKQFGALLANTSLSYLYQDRQGRTYALNVFQYKQIDPVGNRLRAFLEPNLTLPQYQHRYLMQDQQGNFWMALAITAQNQQILMKFSPDWKLLNQYPLPDATRFGNFGNRILEDKTGRLWIGATSGKLVLFDPRQETFRVLSYQHLMPQSGTATETYALYFDQAATLWIGTQYGLIKAESSLTNPRFTRYKNSPTDRQSLSNDFISCVLDDPFLPNRYLWISTKGGGLDRLDKQSGHFQHFTEKEGLPNKVVYGLLLDEYKQIWLSTNRGLAQFNPKTFRFRNYTKVDGLQDDEFNTGSYVKAPTGELLFGGVNGLNHFRASQVAPTHGPVPQAHLIGLKVNNEPVLVGAQNGILTQSLESTERIELAHNQNLVTVEFGVMDFTNPAGNRYRYKLQGIDQDWVEAGTNRFANYAQLPDGTYTLQMMGSADGVVWSQPVTLQIQVHPPFYRTWWAYLFYLLVLAVLGWQVYRFQLQRAILQQKVVFEQTQSQRLAELDALKTQFFANISHEFRTPLTLILGPLADLKQRFPLESVLGMMERNASRLLSLINQLLDLSKLEVNQLKPEPTNGELAAFLRTVASSFESLARSLAIQFIFTQDKTVYWASFDRDKLEKIISNLLSNAFKFTPANQSVQMTAQFQEDYNRLVIKVQDTGIGIAPHHLAHIFERFYQVDGNSNRSYEGTGIGLALVNELVTVLGGTITVESTEGGGTTFQVTLPLVPVAPAAQDPLTNYQPQDVLTERLAVDSEQEAATGTPRVRKASATQATRENRLLIVDDNADIRTYVRSIFQTDYQIVEAEDGQDGFEKATALLPNVVICDLMMPRLDGFGFCRALKSQEATSHIPVIMLTAKATIEDRIEGFELGADDYLTKPFNRQEVQVRVRNLLDKQERLRSYFRNQSVSAPTVIPVEAVVRALSREAIFLQKARQVLEVHYGNSQFGVDEFSLAMNLSPSQLLRKLRALTSMTTVEFLRRYRLEQAALLLATRSTSVSDTAYQVGFESLPYFTKVFQEQYGVPPSEYGSTPVNSTD